MQHIYITYKSLPPQKFSFDPRVQITIRDHNMALDITSQVEKSYKLQQLSIEERP